MPLTISDEAFNFIVSQEDSGEAYYAKHYTHFEWPQGASGPTIGIGYDCGYVTTAQAIADWSTTVDGLTMAAILPACGLRGQAAQAFVQQNRNTVTITWDQAIAEFRNFEMPKWIAKVSADLPNCDQLSPDSFGALVSLSYNRGCSYDLPGPRYAEMRAIKAHMQAQNFAAIPADILAMQRLWPQNSGLWRRRAGEAALFQNGLTQGQGAAA